MQLVVKQNEIGRFNLLGNEESLEFSLAIKDDKGVVRDNDIPCILKLSTEDLDMQDNMQDWLDSGEIGEIFNECMTYALRVWSSTDYKAQCIAFWTVYKKNKQELTGSFLKAKREEIEKQLARLQEKLAELEDWSFIDFGYDAGICNKIELYEKWIESDKKELEQIKEGTDKYAEKEKSITERSAKLSALQGLLGDDN